MSHSVLCPYCQTRFDRDKEEYAIIGTRRYAHAACMLREAQKDPTYQKKEIIDPLDTVICAYCKKELSKKSQDCVMVSNNKYVHKKCQELEEHREKTDKEKLEDYIKQLFDMDYVSPRVKTQITKFIEEYNFTYSGIQKALYYFYEIKGGDLSKSNGKISIVPYVYQDAYRYFYNLWLAKQKNKDIKIEYYEPKVKEITIQRPQRNVRKRVLFEFLNEEE
jgi:hypothetical protein